VEDPDGFAWSKAKFLIMAVSDVRDYLLSVENDKSEAFRIAERAAHSAWENPIGWVLDLLTRLQDCNHGNVLS
jgi:hypothetical protein